MTLFIDNRSARRLWLYGTQLLSPPVGRLDAAAIVDDLGYVQLDSIQNIVRAHHHIIWSRNQHYRESTFDKLLGSERRVFEHFTHDASILPMHSLPMWRRQFQRLGDRAARSSAYRDRLDARGETRLLARIREEGPLSTAAFESSSQAGKPKAMWQRPPHKQTLDYLWYSGVLATDSRRQFQKFYDLAERVFPDDLRQLSPTTSEQVGWLCQQAVRRLVYGSAGEIRRFFDAVSVAETQAWLSASDQTVIPVEVEAANGSCHAQWARADVADLMSSVPEPTSRLRILNPFDPCVRDRTRMTRWFGFDYRIEIFVPAARRRYGYYVYPLLEGHRFVGRLQARADRRSGQLMVEQLWCEHGVRWTAHRADKLDAELNRLARFAGLESVTWSCSSKPLATPE